jgi:hypothetical protein
MRFAQGLLRWRFRTFTYHSNKNVSLEQNTYERMPEPMTKTWLIAIPGILALVAVYVVIALLLVNYSLAWTIPDIFPGAVAQGLVAESISWYTAFKVAIFVAVLAGLAGALAEQGVVTTR